MIIELDPDDADRVLVAVSMAVGVLKRAAQGERRASVAEYEALLQTLTRQVPSRRYDRQEAT